MIDCDWAWRFGEGACNMYTSRHFLRPRIPRVHIMFALYATHPPLETSRPSPPPKRKYLIIGFPPIHRDARLRVTGLPGPGTYRAAFTPLTHHTSGPTKTIVFLWILAVFGPWPLRPPWPPWPPTHENHCFPMVFGHFRALAALAALAAFSRG